MFTQLKYEFKMFFREPLYVFFSLLLPAISYAMFGAMYGNQTYGNLDYFSAYVPGFIVIIMFTACIFSVGFQNVMNRELGVYKRLMATPVSLNMVLMTTLVRGSIVAVVGLLEILLITKFGFDKSLTEYWMQFLLGYILVTFISLVIGFFIGIIFKKTKTALMALMAAMYPVMFLSDATIPLSAMPKIMQDIAPIINPLYHMNILLRACWNGTLFEMEKDVVIAGIYLVCVAVILIIVSAICYRKEEN